MIIGQLDQWQGDITMTRDSRNKWTVSQSYISSVNTWQPPSNPVFAKAPILPLYDYEMSKQDDYYIFKVIWKYPENEQAASSSQLGRETDLYSNNNTFSFGVSLEQKDLEDHPKFDSFASTLEDFKKIYDSVIAGKIVFDSSNNTIQRVNYQDTSVDADTIKKWRATLGNNYANYKTYHDIRNKGITSFLSPSYSYSTTVSDGVDYDPLTNKALASFISQSDKSYILESEVISIDANNFTTTTKNHQSFEI